MTNDSFDLAVIGGGINGCGIARDAAGRGLSVVLIEQGDIASATSQWSSKMVHGGLRYLEHYEFRLVRESLREREVLLKLAPHLIEPAEFIVPHDRSMRPAWMVRAGLLLYDHLGGHISLPRSRRIEFPDPRYSAALKPVFARGFLYSDTRVDDARLTLANALSARDKGAVVRVGCKLRSGERAGHGWRLTVRARGQARDEVLQARGVVNAAGPWVKAVLDDALHVASDATVRLVKGSHIVVPRIHEFAHAYLLQNDDQRVIFVIPYEGRFTLIGTTDVAISALDEARAISPDETAYLLRAVNRYLAKPLRERDIVWSYAGVRPLYDDGQGDPSAITRDYVFRLEAAGTSSPLLSVFGGKLTTYRKLAEHALEQLAPYYPRLGPPWTAKAALPGGAFDDRGEALRALQAQHPRLPADFLERLFRRHGSNAGIVLEG
ncbi:MAG TPA: glycerol-3-phosphate dehydrogenase, partial [Usitatibacteraceae bacterium]|nr:glycerol-3-phosphate dehydrogenase [Usitatibacteraceae bacterium]